MRIRVFTKFDPEIKNLWLDLETRAEPYIFQRYRWLFHWNESIGKKFPHTKPILIFLEDSEGPQVLFPLGLQKLNQIKILRFLGGNESDYHCPIYTLKGKAILQQPGLLESTLSKLPEYDVLHFQKIPEEIVNQSLSHLKKDKIYLSNNSYSAELPSCWGDFQKRLSSKIKADSRRQNKRLLEKGELRFELIEQGDEKRSCVLNTFFDQKRKRYQQSGAYDILSSTDVKNFYAEIPSELGKDVRTQLSALFLDNYILAIHWGVYDKSCFYYLMPTFNDEWSSFSPGRLLLEHLIKWAINQKENF